MSEHAPHPTPDDFRFRCPISVRFRDLDAMGHVNNAVYFSYMETGRTGYMLALDPALSAATRAGELFPFIMLETRCRYLAPVVLHTPLEVHVRVSRVGGKSFDFEYLLTRSDTGEAVAVGTSTQVWYDYGAERTLAIPGEIRARIAAFEGGAEQDSGR